MHAEACFRITTGIHTFAFSLEIICLKKINQIMTGGGMF